MTSVHAQARNRTNNQATTSLLGLLFLTFVGACISRWLARYGVSLSLALGWCLLIGAAVGVSIGISSLMLKYLRISSSRHSYDIAKIIIACGAAGAAGGLLAGSLGFVVCQFSLGRIARIDIANMWVKALIDPGRGPHFVVDVSVNLMLFMSSFAFAASSANALAVVFVHLRSQSVRYVALTALATSAITTVVPSIGLFVYALGARPPVGALGMMSLFVCWVPAYGACSLLVGAAISTFWIWTHHAQTSRVSWLVLWFMVVWLVLFVTEAGLLD